MAFINKYGVQIAPIADGEIKHDPSWMYCNESGHASIRKTFTYKPEFDDLGH